MGRHMWPMDCLGEDMELDASPKKDPHAGLLIRTALEEAFVTKWIYHKGRYSLPRDVDVSMSEVLDLLHNEAVDGRNSCML